MASKTADELLKWGLQNAPASGDQSSVAQVSDDIAAGRRPDLRDPGLYDAIMGKSDAQMMQEELGVAMDKGRTEEDRCTALDNFEMLIEQIDNANNMESMKMWPAILLLLKEETPEIKTQAAWIAGTAVQNNDKAQAAALGHGFLPVLVSMVNAPTPSLRNKAVYALSALMGHYPAAVAQFGEQDGWAALHKALTDSPIVLRRKIAFLLQQLLVQDPTNPAHPAMEEEVQAPPKPVVSSTPGLPPVPLDQGPVTQQGNVKHPDVAKAMLDSSLFETILLSLLPGLEGDAAMCDGTPTRNDLDYAEKSVRVVLALVEKVQNAYTLPADALHALLRDLEGPAYEGSGTRAEELAVEPAALDVLRKQLA